jgi:translation initiation factor IF-2
MAQEAQEGLRAQRIAEMSTTGSMVTLSSLATIDEDTDTLQRMNLIIKGDTSGVVEAIKGALQALPQESVVLRYLLCAAGDITVSDVDLAAASSGMVVGFNLSPDEAVMSHAKRLGVTINTYKVIYNLIDDVKAAMEGKLRSVEERLPVGTATVKAVFGSGKKKVAGCLVDEGKLQKGAMVEVTRGKQGVVFTGKLQSLRRIKDNVDEVQAGLECGVGAEDWQSWQEGDVISCYMSVTKAQRLEDAKAATAVDVGTL